MSDMLFESFVIFTWSIPIRSAGFPDPAHALTSGQRRLIALAEVVLCSGLPTQSSVNRATAGCRGLDERIDGQLSPPFAFALLLLDSTCCVG